MTRAQHLRWAKDRALEYAESGDAANALASIGSDLDKHPETANHPGVRLGMTLLLAGQFKSPQEIVHYIEGFN